MQQVQANAKLGVNFAGAWGAREDAVKIHIMCCFATDAVTGSFKIGG